MRPFVRKTYMYLKDTQVDLDGKKYRVSGEENLTKKTVLHSELINLM